MAKISPKYFNIYFVVIYNEDERIVVSNKHLFDANHCAVCGGVFFIFYFFVHKWAKKSR